MTKEKQSLKNEPGRKVLRFFRVHQALKDIKKLLVGVSGGPDSVCLFHLLYGLRNKLQIDIHIAHMDHQLRGAESSADAAFVERLARQFNIPATIEARSVQEYRTREKLSLEEAARGVRYNFFAETARKVKAHAIALGHTRDDDVETILIHLLRGTGTRGLRGLLPVTEWESGDNRITVLRPLLNISHRETEQYCRDNQIESRTDTTNTSLLLFRNRIRLELLPLLRSYNPEFDAALLRTATIAKDEYQFLDEIAQSKWKGIVKQVDQTMIFDRKRLLLESPAIQRQLLRTSLEKIYGNLQDIETKHIEEMMEIILKPAGRRVHLRDRIIFSGEYDRFILGKHPWELCPLPLLSSETELDIPGETVLPGWTVAAEVLPVDTSKKQVGESSEKMPGDRMYDEFREFFDYDETGDQLRVRAVRTGDQFQPLGLKEIKKVSRFLIDTKVPRDWRLRVPIVVAPTKIIWVAGWRIDDRTKITEKTKRVLKLSFVKRKTIPE